ncbi:hypothetical protein EDD37DRAFT_184594 [Exophiala viscosa]|uniref:Uncharacterized protein n=1 Tax=Exophiala viscosa TaxID=2486360 RepID=A0AAN6DLG3_9EURO|nr:hypothetical protein EDD36DRAFT_107195 [Exophiala viscosa]KAI1620082.1 hypothetical protein EDD37DRAFT_184594 [Exophiala viscosa]
MLIPTDDGCLNPPELHSLIRSQDSSLVARQNLLPPPLSTTIETMALPDTAKVRSLKSSLSYAHAVPLCEQSTLTTVQTEEKIKHIACNRSDEFTASLIESLIRDDADDEWQPPKKRKEKDENKDEDEDQDDMTGGRPAYLFLVAIVTLLFVIAAS